MTRDEFLRLTRERIAAYHEKRQAGTTVGSPWLVLGDFDHDRFEKLDAIDLHDPALFADVVDLVREECPDLQWLWLNGTGVSDLTPLAGLAGLQQLSLDRTGVSDLTPLLALPSLVELWLRNSAVDIPESLISSIDARNILAYWREQHDAESVGADAPVREVKILLVGQGRVGKTHLRKRVLSGPESQPDHAAEETSTHNIEMSHLQQIPRSLDELHDTSPQPNEVRARVWDFGGQDYLHGTHRFFLGAEHALYVLVLDATKTPTENRLNYWLRFLAHHGTSQANNQLRAPVVIVFNKCDFVTRAEEPQCGDLRPDEERTLTAAQVRENWQAMQRELTTAEEQGWYGAHVIGEPIVGMGWREEYEHHPRRDVFQHTHHAALEQCLQRLHEALSVVVALNDTRPGSFFPLKRWVEETFHADEAPPPFTRYFERTNIAFRQALTEHAREHNAREPDASLEAVYLQLLVDLGLIHWLGGRPEHRDGLDHVATQYVFNPNWVKRPVYWLIRTSNSKDGFVRLGSIRNELQSNDAGGLSEVDQNLVLKLMQACHVAHEHRTPEGVDGYVIPDLLRFRETERLPDDASEFLQGVEETDTHSVRWEFPFLPERVFLRYVTDHYLHIEDRHRHCSRNSVLVSTCPRYNDCHVLLQCDISPPEGNPPFINLWITGGNGRDREWTSNTIRHEFENILESEGLPAIADDAAQLQQARDLTQMTPTLPSVLRRSSHISELQASPADHAEQNGVIKIVVDEPSQSVRVNGEERRLTDIPWKLLLYLSKQFDNPNTRTRFVSYDEIRENVYDSRSVQDNTIQAQKGKIKKALAIEIIDGKSRPGHYRILNSTEFSLKLNSD
ncbi:MAG: hypothetical protein KDA52_05415 [Planctomycetaceae bacterium]|nr:hypothetical protein [Planctomycetaceae bacterium]